MNIFGLTLWKPIANGSGYLPDIFPMPIESLLFVKNDILTIYSKILTDVIERTEGIPEEALNLLWDSCLRSESAEGLITLLSKAMEQKTDLFLVYKDGVIRRADNTESMQIRADYKKTGRSSVGVFISFVDYKRTDMVRLYSTLEYGVISSLHKGVNLSKAVQYKINDLRGSVALIDQAKAQAQASEIARALSAGKDVMLDGKDEIASHKPDLEATSKSIEFLDAKRCFYLGLPKSYVNGDQPGGLGDSGVGDAKAVERGLKSYFVSIVKPVMNAIFGVTVSFKSSDFAQVATALEALKTFSLIDDAYLDSEKKQLIVNRLLGF